MAILDYTKNYAQSCEYNAGEPTLCQEFTPFTPDFTISTPTQSLNLNDWANKKILLEAPLTVNSTFSITNCIIKVGSGGSILVTNSGSLTCTFSKIFSCNSTGWPGIRVTGNAFMQLAVSRVEDAERAVWIDSPDATLSIIFNVFNRNDVGIYSDSPIANAVIGANQFKCTSDIYSGNRSSAGITADHSTIVVGKDDVTDALFANQFENLKIGINSTNASVFTLRNCNICCSAQNGVYAENGKLFIGQVTATPPVYNNIFSYNRQDIRSVGSVLDINNADMSNCKTDNIISEHNILGQKININHNLINVSNNNTITSAKIAISVERPSGNQTGFNFIDDNTITVQPFNLGISRKGIKVMTTPGTGGYFDIKNNTIHFGAGGDVPSGGHESIMVEVAVTDAPNFRIVGNRIFSSNDNNLDFGFRRGVKLHSYMEPSINNYLQYNTIKGIVDNVDFGLCAFHFEGSGPWNICSNITDSTLRGFHLQFHCDPSKFKLNHIGLHATHPSTSGAVNRTAGLLMEAQAILGPQSCGLNTWEISDYTPDDGAWYKGTKYNENRFLVDIAQSMTLPNPIGLTSNNNIALFPNLWFGSSPDNCPDRLSCIESSSTETRDTLDDFNRQIIHNNPVYDAPIDANAWEEKKGLMRILLRYPLLRNNDQPVDSFYNAFINASEGAFARFEEQQYKAWLFEANESNALNSKLDQIIAVRGQIDSLDNTLADTAMVFHISPTFFAYRKNLLWKIQSLSIAYDSITHLRQNAMDSASAQLEQAWEDLPEYTTVESNMKFLYALSLNAHQGQPVSNSELTRLRQMTEQCYHYAGYTKFRAMNFLAEGDPYKIHPDVLDLSLGCTAGSETANGLPANDIILSPNPTAQTATVLFPNSFTGQIRVLSLSGQVAMPYQEVTSAERVSIDIQRLPAGIYLIQCIPAGKRDVKLLKLVINR